VTDSLLELPVEPLAQLRLRRSSKWHTYPANVLPLTVAESDFALAEPIRDVLREAVERSDTGYAAPVPDLGLAIAGFAAHRWNWQVDPAAVHSVTDVGVGMVELLRMLTRPGDTVLISPPVYPPFFHWIAEAGVELSEVPLARNSAGWQLDLAALERAFQARPAVYLLCNPQNPVGRVHRPDELAALVELAARYQVRILSDEIHAPLVLPGACFTPLLSLPGAGELALALVSASKAWNLAGLKCAAIVAGSPSMRRLLDRLPPDARWRIGHFGVLATVAAFTDGQLWLDRLLHTLDLRRRQLAELLDARLPMLGWQPPEATYLAWLDCAVLGTGDQAQQLFLDGGVAVEPGSRFGAAGTSHVRLNFGTGAEILDQATAAMAAALRLDQPGSPIRTNCN
jgi:cystathionine beta-lyase